MEYIVREALKAAAALVAAMETCHECHALVYVEPAGPIHCEDGCSSSCEVHPAPGCEGVDVIHARLKELLANVPPAESEPA